jgi:hypothetical protein
MRYANGFPLPLLHGERARVRGKALLRRLWLPLTPTLSPQAGRGRYEQETPSC